MKLLAELFKVVKLVVGFKLITTFLKLLGL